MKAYYVKFKNDSTDEEILDSLKVACATAGSSNLVFVSIEGFTQLLNARLHEHGVKFITDRESLNENKFAVLDGVTIGVVKVLDYSLKSDRETRGTQEEV